MTRNFDEQAVSSEAYTKKNYRLLFIRQDDVDDLGAIISCAVRYCIGRESYMPRLVVDFIKRYPQLLTSKSAGSMIRDLEQARNEPQTEWERQHNRTAFGLNYQKDMWLEFLAWLRDEYEIMTARQNEGETP